MCASMCSLSHRLSECLACVALYGRSTLDWFCWVRRRSLVRFVLIARLVSVAATANNTLLLILLHTLYSTHNTTDNAGNRCRSIGRRQQSLRASSQYIILFSSTTTTTVGTTGIASLRSFFGLLQHCTCFSHNNIIISFVVNYAAPCVCLLQLLCDNLSIHSERVSGIMCE